MLDTSLRARSVSEIVDASFAVYRQNALQLIVVTAIAMSPSIIYTLVMSGTPPTTPEEIVKFLPVLVVSMLSYALVGAVISRMGSDIYLGHPADVAATVRDVIRRVPSIFGAMIMLFVLTVIATIFLILPVFWVAAMFYATVPIIVIERKGAFAAMSRSAALSKGHKWHILGTLALTLGIYMMLSIGLTLVAAAIGGQMLQTIVGSLYGVVVGPIVNLSVVVLYYDTRIRKEGFDVEHMAQALGTAPTDTSMSGSVA